MLTRCPLIVALLSCALLLAVSGTAVAQESDVELQEPDVELWLQRCEPEMTASLSSQIERDTSRRLSPIVERRLLAAVSAGPPPASPALAVDPDGVPPAASQTSMTCVVRGASSFACVVRPIR